MYEFLFIIYDETNDIKTLNQVSLLDTVRENSNLKLLFKSIDLPDIRIQILKITPWINLELKKLFEILFETALGSKTPRQWI